jgi:hypothetical protein
MDSELRLLETSIFIRERRNKSMKLTFTKLLKIIPDGIFEADDIVTKDGRKGVRYMLYQPLGERQIRLLAKYSNIKLSVARYRYAPEITHDCVTILED